MMGRLWFSACLLTLCGPVSTLASELTAELEQVQARRQQTEQLYDEQMHDCRHRFNVNDCLNQVQFQRTQALGPLLKQQRALQEELRRQKADSRKADIQQRRQAHILRSDPAQAVEATPISETSRP